MLSAWRGNGGAAARIKFDAPGVILHRMIGLGLGELAAAGIVVGMAGANVVNRGQMSRSEALLLALWPLALGGIVTIFAGSLGVVAAAVSYWWLAPWRMR